MEVSLKLVGPLVDRVSHGGARGEPPRVTTAVELPDGATLPMLIEHVGLSADAEYFAMVNNDHVPAERLQTHELNGGDKVVLCPPLKGG